jgi:hypothetical protein
MRPAPGNAAATKTRTGCCVSTPEVHQPHDPFPTRPHPDCRHRNACIVPGSPQPCVAAQEGRSWRLTGRGDGVRTLPSIFAWCQRKVRAYSEFSGRNALGGRESNRVRRPRAAPRREGRCRPAKDGQVGLDELIPIDVLDDLSSEGRVSSVDNRDGGVHPKTISCRMQRGLLASYRRPSAPATIWALRRCSLTILGHSWDCRGLGSRGGLWHARSRGTPEATYPAFPA